MKDVPLFGEPPKPPMVPEVVFNKKIQWLRIQVLMKPTCGHCQMLMHSGKPIVVQRAGWTRIGRDGSVLELCEGHMVQQRRRDGA